jgi:hypothetical protein
MVQETITGSDLSGVDGATDRNYTLSTSGYVDGSLVVIVDNAPLHPVKDFTVTAGVVTFLNETFDDSNITFYYDVSPSSVGSGSYYCEPSDVQRLLRINSAFSSSSNPSENQVYAFIEDAMSDIDSLTRHAWRAVTETNEYHSLPQKYNYIYGLGVRIKLGHRLVRTLETAQGDKLEVWDGNSWEDWIVNKNSGRGNDYWLDETNGVLYLNQAHWYFRDNVIRVTYRYGESTIPRDIRKACALLVASEIVASDQFSSLLKASADGKNMNNQSRSELFEKKAAEILDRHKEWFAA